MTIGVFFGGKSPEHDVSIITGQLIISELKKIKEHKIVAVYLDKNGFWYLDEELSNLKYFYNANLEARLASMAKYSLDLGKSNGKMVFRKNSFRKSEVVVDFAFPAFHGANGEDGTIQGLFEILNIPYSGCDVASSALAMDKILTKTLYKANNIETTEFVYFSKKNWHDDKAVLLHTIEEKLRFPLFVKPPKLGSSIGISRATNKQELEFGIEVAFHYGGKVLIENGVENLADLTCAVIGDDNPTASLVQESLFLSDFFNYEEKYLKDGGAQTGNAEENIVIPARLDEAVTKSLRETAIKIYKDFGCSGIARVDFLFDKVQNKLYANEINTMPGTLYHHLWKASGIELDDLIKRLINLGIEKHHEKNSYEYIFKSDLLKMAKSVKLRY